jgi:transcriptional regulator with XRE-family HTH domain
MTADNESDRTDETGASPQAKRAAIAGRLRAAREMAGLSQGQVARLMEMHRPTVTEIEAGRRRVNAEELAALSKLYAVSTEWLSGAGPDAVEPTDARVELAARELTKLKPDDLDRVLHLLAALRPPEPTER